MQVLLLNLLKTLIAETPVYGFYLRREGAFAWIFILLINGLTLPLATLAFHRFGWNWYLVEFLVATSEGLLVWLFFKRGFAPSMAIAFLANGISAFIYRYIDIGF